MFEISFTTKVIETLNIAGINHTANIPLNYRAAETELFASTSNTTLDANSLT